MNHMQESHLVTFIEDLLTKTETIRGRVTRRSLTNLPASIFNVDYCSDVLWVEFTNGQEKQVLTIPVPSTQANGNYIITTQSGVKRSVGTWLIDGKELSYWQLMSWLLMDRVEKFLPTKSKRIYLERLIRSFDYGQAPMVFRNFQRIVDDIVNRLPLVGTEMQSWAMCNRVQIIDPEWDSFTPQQALEYQKTLNAEMFPYTSLGQSDSGMCNNTLLKVDVRKTVPYGLYHHNPNRNLYQTLGVKGDEVPCVMSEYEKSLANQGIVRTGWELMTVFCDLPSNYEDQIIVSDRLKDLFVEDTKKYVCYGKVVVEAGDETNFLHPISIEPDGSVIRFNLRADSATIESVEDTQVNFNGGQEEVKTVTVKYKRVFKDGFKLTNRHGNKGIIKLAHTGTVHDPVRGDVPIDIIVSAKSVMKRKNFGQLLEALTTLIHGKDSEIVIPDNAVCHLDTISPLLKQKGYNKDGTCRTTTPWGEFKAVCGWVHWGCLKTPEDQTWNKFDTRSTNNKEVRTAGNKFSHIESRALVTMFGPGNPVLKEILSHRQGHDLVFNLLQVLDTMRGVQQDLPIVNWDAIKPIDQRTGFFHDAEEFTGTIGDTSLLEKGFYFKLPENFRYVVRRLDNNEFNEEFVREDRIISRDNCVVLDKILVPSATLRKPWKHQSGKYGLSDIAALLNTIIGAIYKYKAQESKEDQIGRAIYMYFHGISKALSSKRGAISNYAMSVRYPWTVKATAAVSEDLEPNEIEIHKTLAMDLRVMDGDFVLVERFPCLGFMSLRVQKVRITDDPECRYVIRVSGNSLTSQALDFDGDVLYLMSFHSDEAKKALEKEFNSPHPARLEAYRESSNSKPVQVKEMNLKQYKLEIFPDLTAIRNAEIVGGLTGIKRGTGTIIALCYNLMRIVERNVGYEDQDMAVAMERLLDKVANSVFSMKHAGKSLEAECREAICTADVEKMVALDLDPAASALLAKIILDKAKELGFTRNSLKTYFHKAEKEGKSSIINIIVRRDHRIWFTSRSFLHPVIMLENLERKPEDLASWLFHFSKQQWKEGMYTAQTI